MNTQTRYKMIFAIYVSGLLQGICLTIFPATGPLLTNPQFHNLTGGQFGFLFTPQIVMAILSSVLMSRWVKWLGGMKPVLLVGLGADMVAMILLAASHAFMGQGQIAYYLLLLATASLGIGVGFTLSVSNAYAFDLFRDRADAAVTALYMMGGSGQVVASLILSLFMDLGFWWGAPTTVAIAVGLMLAFNVTLPLRLASENTTEETNQPPQRALPLRIWLYALVLFLYGTCENTYGNWSSIYLNKEVGLDLSEAGLALSVFWGAITLGRTLFSFVFLRLKPTYFYMASPLIMAATFVALPLIDGYWPKLGILGIAGLCMSFYFPLSVSLPSNEEPDLTPRISGIMVAAVMLGAGYSANSVGYLSQSISLAQIFQATSLYAIVMGGLVAYLGMTRKTA